MFTQAKLYAALVIAVLLAGLIATALWYRGQAISASAEARDAQKQLSVAVDANKAANSTIDALQEQARLDSRLVSSLVQEMRNIGASVEDQSQKLSELEKSNEVVRDFLNRPVPSDLGKLYQH
ncbi:hypothetical protein [Rhizobiales bacterium 3FA27D7]|jgi:LysB family phage lysis regulatory protein|uniref:hypothetical protein n=1 Tax=Mesorhizobium sp. 2RAF21 TaxID=3232995 RepID=UPI0010F66A62